MTDATVAVVIPVYNAGAYLDATLDSIWAQTLDQARIEVIAVDDGSTDDSRERLHRHSADHSNLRVISQPPSGSPSGPRNTGIDRATSDFIFFLDSDDLLTPGALERMVTVAEEYEADVVLAKMEGLNGRAGVPRSMFGADHMDADIVEQRLYLALGPTKLFRRTHLLDRGLRFPTDLRVGEDKAFVAEALLTSRRTCVVADQAYYLVRERDDPSEHIGRASETAEQALLKAERLAAVLTAHTEPGERRDVMMQRVFGGSLQGAFRGKLLQMDPQARRVIVDRAMASLGVAWTPGARDHVSPVGQVLLDLVFAGRLDELVELERWRSAHDDRLLVASDGAWGLDLPASVLAATQPATGVTAPRTEYLLTGLAACKRALVVQGWAGLVGTTRPPDEIRLVWQRRSDGATHQVAAEIGAVTQGKTVTRWFRASTELDHLPHGDGVWDAHLLLVSSGVTATRQRLGSRRLPSVPTRGLDVDGAGRAYFTATYSNLSLELTAMGAGARIVGADRGPEGSLVLYLASARSSGAPTLVTVTGADGSASPLEHDVIGPGMSVVRLAPGPGARPTLHVAWDRSPVAVSVPREVVLPPRHVSVPPPAVSLTVRTRRAAKKTVASAARMLPDPVETWARSVATRLRGR